MAHIRETLIAGMTRPEYRAPLVQHGLADKSIAGYGGITYDRTDAWFAGMDRAVTCLVWVGHDKDAPINPKATAAKVALPLWAAVFAMVTEGKPHGWDVKPGLSQLLVTAPRAIPVGRTRGQPEALPVHPVSGAVIGNDPYQSVGAVPRAVPVPSAGNEE